MRCICWFIASLIVVGITAQVQAQTSEAQALYNSGKYAECIAACEKATANDRWDEDHAVLKMRAELTLGKTEDALKTLQSSLSSQPQSVRLLLAGIDVLRANDRADEAEKLPAVIRAMAVDNPWRYGSPPDRIAVGKALLMMGADPRQVLELVYDRIRKDTPEYAEVHLAMGEMALDKNDFALAADSYREAVRRLPDNPDAHFGLTRAFQNDSERAAASLTKALELNPRHIDALLYQADNAIDQEAYEDAQDLLKQVLEINPKQPTAWAYKAVLAHLLGDKALEDKCRGEALSTWKTNPAVDNLIGTKLSQKYRFAEGESYQRQALRFSASYLPAMIQLCQDLLRLGREDEGWRLAEQVFTADKYNVLAFNLTTLRDNLRKFRTTDDPHFALRMDPREQQIYGRRATELLQRAHKRLTEKYGVSLPQKTSVEVFPQQKDFAIRTFGLPGGAGFLGVCFGPVITINSPASRVAHPSNWHAIFWHEFCHTITLTKTRNKMPRWLSEGISVYEERQENSAWGQSMTPQYRQLILDGGATPVSKLSGAFLKPPTPMHLQFAYYESSMVVQYVVDRFGISSLQKILSDLGEGVPINAALARNTEPIEKLDDNFAKYLKDLAENLAPGVDWERPKLALDADSAAIAAWNKDHPNSFFGLLAEGQALLAEEKHAAATVPLLKAVALYPKYGEVGGPYALLAGCYRGLGQTDQEKQMLIRHVSLNADAIEPRLRLAEILVAEKDWPGVKDVAEQVLAVNPLTPAPHRLLAQAAEALNDRMLAIESHRTLLLMNPLDAADHHYRLAKLLFEGDQLALARREVLQALEEAPRYREAHRLLLEIVGKMGEAQPTTAPMPEAPMPFAPTRQTPATAPTPTPQ
jgi:tetratricopeptide (TPR) repeat protein